MYSTIMELSFISWWRVDARVWQRSRAYQIYSFSKKMWINNSKMGAFCSCNDANAHQKKKKVEGEKKDASHINTVAERKLSCT
jgi:hypothetical protein